MARYSTSAAPGAVIESYKQALSAAGWTVTGGGGGDRGGGFQATSGPKYTVVQRGRTAGHDVRERVRLADQTAERSL